MMPLVGMLAAVGIGSVTGFCGAIPPGPVGVAVLQRAADGRPGHALLIGLGGAAGDATICAGIALGAGPLLAGIVSQPLVKLALAGIYMSIGVYIVAEALVRPRGRP